MVGQGWTLVVRDVAAELSRFDQLRRSLEIPRKTLTDRLDPRLLRRRTFTAGTISITAQYFAFFGFVFLILQYLQLVRGDSPLVAAVSVLPVAAGLMPAAPVAGRLVERVGQRGLTVAGLVLVAAVLGWLATATPARPTGHSPVGSSPWESARAWR